MKLRIVSKKLKQEQFRQANHLRFNPHLKNDQNHSMITF